jgi:hypothetical protein
MIDDHRQRAVLDLNGVCAIDRLGRCLRHYDRHRLADVTHLIDREWGGLDRL